MNNRAQEIADELLGTDQPLDDVAERHEFEDYTLLHEIGEYAQRCTVCCFWFDPEELDTTDGDCICEECLENA